MSTPTPLSNLIFSTVYQEVIGNEASPYNLLRKKIYDIDTNYFEKIHADTEQLPDALNPKLRDDIVESIRNLAESHLGPSFENQLLKIVHQKIKADCPNANQQSIAVACDEASKELLKAAKIRFDHPRYDYEEPCPKVTEAGLMKLYRKARLRTPGERIQQDNKEDVIAFHHALLYKTVWECKQLVEDKVVALIGHITERLSEGKP